MNQLYRTGIQTLSDRHSLPSLTQACLPCRALAILVLLHLCSLAGCARPEPEPDPQLVALHNRGVALMGQFNYDEAYRIFEQVHQALPENLEVQVNWAIASLNRQGAVEEEGKGQPPKAQDPYAHAMGLLQDVLRKDPNHLRALYCLGLLHLHGGRPAEALPLFDQVAAADPTDAYAAYNVGRCYQEAREFEEAVLWFRRALRNDPHLSSTYYSLSQALTRLKRSKEAASLLADSERLKNNPCARPFKFVYTRMGPKADVVALGRREQPPAPTGPPFAEPRPLPLARDALRWRPKGASLTACDVDADGRLDLFAAAALEGGKRSVLLVRTDTGYKATPHPLADVPDVRAALWGDIDNDGLIDAYLCRAGGNQLWRQSSPGTWEQVDPASGAAGRSLEAEDGALVDIDHDGDLDILVVSRDAGLEMLHNTQDGRFVLADTDVPWFRHNEPAVGLMPADLDGDRDLDLIVVRAKPPHHIYINERNWTWKETIDLGGFRFAECQAVLVADADVDGRPELYALHRGTVTRWQSDDKGNWQSAQLAALEPARAEQRPQLAIADVSGTGRLSLLASTASGWAAIPLDGPPAEGATPVTFQGKATKLHCWLLLHDDPAAGPSVVGLSQGGMQQWGPANRQRFVSLWPSGKHDSNMQLRSNASGVGTRMAVRVGSRWTVVESTRPASGPGQSWQPVSVGMGPAERADFVRFDWSDGIMQTEIGLDAGKLHRVVEENRQTSSCPLVFAWDGSGYAFVTDVLGVGGVGFAVGRGVYAPSRPWERLLLPAGLPAPRGGRLSLKLLQAMEEVCYVDAARLTAYDLPPGWQMVLDERMATAAPEPTGEALFYRTLYRPDAAVGPGGEDALSAVSDVDGVAVEPGSRDRRFVGRTFPWSVELRFAEPLDRRGGRLLLIADGWVEYPYSQTMFAAWQAGAAYESPTLEAQGSDGRWQTVLAGFGYPAGMPRSLAIPLPELPVGTQRLRLTTTMEIYWDRLAIGVAEPCPAARRHELPLLRATLARCGFPRRTMGPQRLPDYDYARRSPFGDMRHLPGLYTRFGPVEELVQAADNAVVVCGAGEEIHMEFAACNTPIEPPWTRRYVLEAEGWCKDMDLYTQHGETVEPLPWDPNRGEPRRRDALHASYLTRWESGD